MLFYQVGKLKEENERLRANQRRMDFPQKTRDLESFQRAEAGNANRSCRGSGRPMSMIESRSMTKPFSIVPESASMAAAKEVAPEGKGRGANANLPPITDTADDNEVSFCFWWSTSDLDLSCLIKEDDVNDDVRYSQNNVHYSGVHYSDSWLKCWYI